MPLASDTQFRACCHAAYQLSLHTFVSTIERMRSARERKSRLHVTCLLSANLSVLQGVAATHIIDGRQQHSLLLELLTGSGVGTMITG